MKKTKNINHAEYTMKSYLQAGNQMDRDMGAFIFSIQAKTADFKVWNMFKHDNNLCYGCQLMEDSFEHLLLCSTFSDSYETVCPIDIYSEDLDKVIYIAEIAMKRF